MSWSLSRILPTAFSLAPWLPSVSPPFAFAALHRASPNPVLPAPLLLRQKNLKKTFQQHASCIPNGCDGCIPCCPPHRKQIGFQGLAATLPTLRHSELRQGEDMAVADCHTAARIASCLTAAFNNRSRCACCLLLVRRVRFNAHGDQGHKQLASRAWRRARGLNNYWHRAAARGGRPARGRRRTGETGDGCVPLAPGAPDFMILAFSG